jgi:hypothetical protein
MHARDLRIAMESRISGFSKIALCFIRGRI